MGESMKDFVDGDKRVINAVRDTVFEVLAYRADGHVRRATKYLSPNMAVTATYRGKRDKRNSRDVIVLKIGAPNYLERKFIKACAKAGEPFPVRKVQLRFARQTKPKGKR